MGMLVGTGVEVAEGAGKAVCVVDVGDAMPIGMLPAGMEVELVDVPGIVVLSGAPIITPGVVADVPDIIVDVSGMVDIVVEVIDTLGIMFEVAGTLDIMVVMGMIGVTAGMVIELAGIMGD